MRVKMEIYIVGASFAGISCALRARDLYPEANITLIEKSSIPAFLPGGLFLYLQGYFEELADAVFITSEELKQQRINLKLRETFIDCDSEQHQITTNKETYHYDKLILANGSEQRSRNVKVIDDEYWNPSYKQYKDAKIALPLIEAANSVAIIGAGQAGMEAASVMHSIGKEVHVFEVMSYPLFKYFDEDFLQSFISEIKKIPRVNFHFDTEVTKIEKNSNYKIYLEKEVVECDHVFALVNVHPEMTKFTKKFKLHSDNTIQTDDYLQTSKEDIFAVGDLIQSPLLWHGNVYLPQINHAIRSGSVAAENLFTAQTKLSAGLRTLGTEIFGSYLATTGLIEADAFFYPEEIGTYSFEQKSSLISENKIYCKVIYEKKSEKILGLQLLSKENCLDKINLAALAIQQGLTTKELTQLDTFFQPLFTDLTEPLTKINLEGGADHAF